MRAWERGYIIIYIIYVPKSVPKGVRRCVPKGGGNGGVRMSLSLLPRIRQEGKQAI